MTNGKKAGGWRLEAGVSRPRNLRRAKHGFTLIEVMAALAIAAGSLVLLLMANQACLQRSMHAQLAASIQLEAEFKFDELRCAAETATRGEFAQHPGWQWVLERQKADLSDLQRLEKLTLSVYAPQTHQPFRTLSMLNFVPALKDQKP